ncbi:MAG: hypothetical protein U0Q12_13080 [Vicinamibacterales bacterium]
MSNGFRAVIRAAVVVGLAGVCAPAAAADGPRPMRPTSGPAVIAVALQAGQPARQDEFVPVDELPPEDRLPAARFVVIAYSFVWVVLFAFVWSIWSRLGRVSADLDALDRQHRRGPSESR